MLSFLVRVHNPGAPVLDVYKSSYGIVIIYPEFTYIYYVYIMACYGRFCPCILIDMVNLHPMPASLLVSLTPAGRKLVQTPLQYAPIGRHSLDL